jgi:DUF1680 family protein
MSLCWSDSNPFLIAMAFATEVAIMATAAAQPADHLTPLELNQVKVGGEIGRRINVTVKNHLLVLDADRDFLKPFKERNRKDGYIGLGKLIDSLVHFALYTGDERVLSLKKRVVAEALKTQEPDGYIGLLVPDKRMWTLWDVHEMSYLVYGLCSDHRHFGEKASLEAACRLADYVITRWSAEPNRIPGNGEITLHMAVTGIEPAMLALYGQTGDRRYLDFVVKFRRVPEWDYPIVLGRWGDIGGHAYTYMCHCLAQIRLNRIQPDARLLGPSHRVVDFLTNRDGLVITGTCGDHECWHDTQAGTINLGETCATAYLIRLLDELLRVEGDSRYGDIMERAVYNALFAAQSPDGRRIRYYSPFEGPRTYFDGDTYCCPSNYRRIVAELPGMIYYRCGGGLAVNLFTASEAKVELDGGLSLVVRQETDYPNSGHVVIRLDPSKPASFPLRVRIPAWSVNASVAVNGQRIEKPVWPGAFFEISRQWRQGDRIELQMPMPMRLVKGRKAQAGRVAVMRGPQVFALARGTNKDLAGTDLRLITIDPATLTGPVKDETVRPDGLACQVRAWAPGSWYPQAPAALKLTLTEFPDPAGQVIYFNVPNPNVKELVEDELIRR